MENELRPPLLHVRVLTACHAEPQRERGVRLRCGCDRGGFAWSSDSTTLFLSRLLVVAPHFFLFKTFAIGAPNHLWPWPKDAEPHLVATQGNQRMAHTVVGIVFMVENLRFSPMSPLSL